MMLQCSGLTAVYGKKEILHGLHFSVPTGEITAVLGHNGSGKTTLLRCLSGTLPYGGSITVAGTEVRSLSPGARARRVAVMPQLFRTPEVTVRELVSFGRQPYTGPGGVLTRADWDAVDAMLDRTGLTALAERRLDRLSGGERQKAYFAMLLAQDTPLLLLDEPGAHLDMAYRKTLTRMLRVEQAAGKTIVVVLHDINRAMELADRVLVLQSGALRFDGSPAALADSTVPGEVFGLERCRCIGPDGSETLPVFR